MIQEARRAFFKEVVGEKRFKIIKSREFGKRIFNREESGTLTEDQVLSRMVNADRRGLDVNEVTLGYYDALGSHRKEVHEMTRLSSAHIQTRSRNRVIVKQPL